ATNNCRTSQRILLRWHARQRHCQKQLRPLNPALCTLDVTAFDGRPRDAMRRLLLPRVAFVRSESMIERLAIYALRMGRQDVTHRRWQILVAAIRHSEPRPS